MIVASNNKGKLEEIKKILSDYKVYSLKDKNISIDVIEDADTFLGNAKKKAKEIYDVVKEPTLADDSGLCITCLGDFPSVMTHRFLGGDASDVERNEYLINAVNRYDDRSARVVCYIVYYDGVDYIIGEGILNGSIATERRGANGFGFDEIFVLDNGKTLAELSSEEKNMVSARGIALRSLKKRL